MDNGQKLPYVIGSVHGSIVEDLLVIAQVHPLILHGTGVAAACGIHRNGIVVDILGQCLGGRRCFAYSGMRLVVLG